MKIAVLSCFYPYRGGISQFNAALVEELGKQGAEVKAFNFKRQYPEFLFPGKTQYITADDHAAPVESDRMLDSVNPLSYCRTARAILRWGPDLVVMRYWMSFFGPSLGYVARYLRRHGVKVVSILDNVIPHEPHWFDRPLTKYFLSGSSGCITLCDAVADDMKRIRPDLPCITIPHPLYTHFGEKMPKEEALKALGLNASKKTLLFFGLIRQYKGLDILLEAFGMLDRDYQLIVAGEPYGSFEPYRKIIDSLGNAAERIKLFPKYIADSEVSVYFSAADLCVLPYRSATQSGVSAVAFHFGVPMLVTDTGGLKETIAGTGAGLLAGECSAQSVADGIRSYFSSGDIAAECRKNIEILKEKLSWKTFARKLQEFSGSIDRI